MANSDPTSRMLGKLMFICIAVVFIDRSTTLSMAADQAGAAEAKLRESLRATTLQLRNAETEKAALQAAQAELESKNKQLTEQLESLTKQTAANQVESERAINELKGKVDERDREIGALRVSLDKWKADHQKISDFARATEAQRAKAADQVIALNHQVEDQQRRNLAMYNLGIEILARYEKFGLGTELTAREPFVGLTRVKFENLIQDYGDKLSDERIKPKGSAASTKPEAPSTTQLPKNSQPASTKAKKAP